MANPQGQPADSGLLKELETGGPAVKRHKGGMARPWIKAMPRMPETFVPPTGAVVLWEEGRKNTVDIKQEIKHLLGRGYTLIEILDSKRAEHPEDPTWWPSLMDVMKWCESDIAFAQMLDSWNHAHQLEISERIKHDVLNAEEEKADPKLLKVKVDYAAKVLPRLVNRGLVERVEVDQTIRGGMQAYEHMPLEALMARAEELARNPKVKKIMTLHMGPSYREPSPAPTPSPAPPPEAPRPGSAIIDVNPELDIPEEP